MAFEGTKRFFDVWIGQALNYVFLVMLTAAMIKLLFTIISMYMDAVLGSYAAAGGADPNFSEIFPMLAVSGIGVLVLMQMPSIASALGGGVAISTMGAARWAFGKASGSIASAASAARPTNLKRSLNKARSDARIAGSAVRAVGGAPMAIYRKITNGGSNRIRRAA